MKNKTKKPQKISVGKDVANWNPVHYWGERKMVQLVSVPQKIKKRIKNYQMIQQFHTWIYNPITEIGVLKRYLYTTFIAAYFTTAKTWKEHKCPLMGQIDKQNVASST